MGTGKINVSVITAFPELFKNFLSFSVFGRAVSKGLVRAEIINFRDFGKGNYKQLDDYAFGSGGMLFAAPQLKEALDFAHEKSGAEKSFTAFPSPQGVLLTQEIIESLALQEHVIIICGHYEGLDERFVENHVDLEFSIGDCVLTGGEIPAMSVIDAMSRLVPGVVGKNNAVIEDSFYKGMLDNPHYTRPAEWEGLKVPEILLSGNENEILKWRRSKAVERTLRRRPDLISRADIRDYVSHGIYLAFMISENHENKNNDFSEVPEISRAYGISRPFLIAEGHDLRENLKRSEKISSFKILGSLSRVIENIGENILIIKVFNEPKINSLHSLEAKRRCLEHNGPILFLLAGDENELENLKIKENSISTYLYNNFESNNNGKELSLNFKAAVILDRILGKR